MKRLIAVAVMCAGLVGCVNQSSVIHVHHESPSSTYDYDVQCHVRTDLCLSYYAWEAHRKYGDGTTRATVTYK